MSEAVGCPVCGGGKHRQSAVCRDCFLKGHRRPENYLLRSCSFCKAQFQVHISQIRRGWGRFCSQPCARQARPKQKRRVPSVTCQNCGCEVALGAGQKHLSKTTTLFASNPVPTKPYTSQPLFA